MAGVTVSGSVRLEIGTARYLLGAQTCFGLEPLTDVRTDPRRLDHEDLR